MNEDREEYVTEVRDTNTVQADPVVQRRTVAVNRVGTGVLIARVIYWITGAIIALLALRFVLLLLGANQESPFVNFIYSLSNVFAWPFYGIFNYQPSYGSSTLELFSIVAIIVYALVGVGLARLATLGSNRADV